MQSYVCLGYHPLISHVLVLIAKDETILTNICFKEVMINQTKLHVDHFKRIQNKSSQIRKPNNSFERQTLYAYYHVCNLPVVPHKAVAEVSRIGNLQERLVVVNPGWQSKDTDGSTGVSGLLSFCAFLALSLTIYLRPSNLSMYQAIYVSSNLSFFSIFLSMFLSISLSIFLSFYLSLYLSFYLSIWLSVYLFICLSVFHTQLSTYLAIQLSSYLPI